MKKFARSLAFLVPVLLLLPSCNKKTNQFERLKKTRGVVTVGENTWTFKNVRFQLELLSNHFSLKAELVAGVTCLNAGGDAIGIGGVIPSGSTVKSLIDKPLELEARADDENICVGEAGGVLTADEGATLVISKVNGDLVQIKLAGNFTLRNPEDLNETFGQFELNGDFKALLIVMNE